MIIWIDAQISPHLASWITQNLHGIEAYSVKYLGLRDAEDLKIYQKAEESDSIVWVLTKDADFVSLQTQLGAPPNIIWLTCGNTTNQNLKRIFSEQKRTLIELMKKGEPLIEISD